MTTVTSTVATTATSHVEAQRTPMSPGVFRVVVAITAAVTMAAVVAPPSDTVSVAVVMVVVAVLGIPHGAVDHLVAAALGSTAPTQLTRSAATPIRPLRFHLAYLAAMLAYGLVWLAIPAVALAGFLLLSVHHFGQSDLASLQLDRWRQGAIQLSRGLFLVGLVLVANLAAVSPVIDRMGGFDPSAWAWLAGHTAAWSLVLVGQHLVIGLIVGAQVRDREIIRREAIAVIALTALFVAADPLIGFALYFGLWHSLNHLGVLAEVLGHRSGSAALAPRQLARLAAPRSVASLAALAILIGGAAALDQTELVVPVALIFISMLTLPHMIVVERLWKAIRLETPSGQRPI